MSVPTPVPPPPGSPVVAALHLTARQGAWVCAAPFRAHLQSLCAGTRLPWQVVALHAGLSVRAADALLHGRDGRPVRRLARDSALRLLAASDATVADLYRTWVDGASTARRLAHLVARGVPLASLAGAAGCSPEYLADLVERARPTTEPVTLALALTVLAVRETLDRASLRAVADAAAA